MNSKDAYVQKLHAKIDEWNAEIDKLKAKSDKKKAERKIEYQKQIGVLEAKRDELKHKASEIKLSGDQAWEDLKAGANLAWKAMEEALKNASTRFK